jgi:hypothetical protein
MESSKVAVILCSYLVLFSGFWLFLTSYNEIYDYVFYAGAVSVIRLVLKQHSC